MEEPYTHIGADEVVEIIKLHRTLISALLANWDKLESAQTRHSCEVSGLQSLLKDLIDCLRMFEKLKLTLYYMQNQVNQ